MFFYKWSAPEYENLKYFEHDLYLLIKSIKFRKCSSSFQKKISDDIRKTRKSKKIIVSRDKTSNLYFISKDEYHQLMLMTWPKIIKKNPANYVDKTNLDAQLIINDTQLKGK